MIFPTHATSLKPLSVGASHKRNMGRNEEKFVIKNPGEKSDCLGFSRLLTGAHRAISGNVIVYFLFTGTKDSSDRSE